ncbi:hypothetical protein Q7P37_001436 [Cladosporium fusiforme]
MAARSQDRSRKSPWHTTGPITSPESAKPHALRASNNTKLKLLSACKESKPQSQSFQWRSLHYPSTWTPPDNSITQGKTDSIIFPYLVVDFQNQSPASTTTGISTTMTIDPYANCNFTIENNNLCTLETCCLAQSPFTYHVTFGGNLFFAILFGVTILPQIGLGIYYKTWGFMVGMVCGLILEVLGYVARVQMHDNPFNGDAFLLYLIALTIAPVFLTAAIYLTLSRVILIYNASLSRLSPRTIALTFMTSDFLSLVLQAVGGAIADTADERALKDAGINIMIAGLVLQAVSLTVFLGVSADFFLRVRKHGMDTSSSAKSATRSRLAFKAFLASLLVATLAILARSIFRAAELWQGFEGDLWNSEVDFMVLDGAMVALAVLLLSLWHPGPAFGAQWHAANWSLRTGKGKDAGVVGERREVMKERSGSESDA